MTFLPCKPSHYKPIFQVFKCGPNQSAYYVKTLNCSRTAVPYLRTCINKNRAETYFSYQVMRSKTVERTCETYKSCIYSFVDDFNPYTKSVQLDHFKKLGLNQIKSEDNNFIVPLPLTKDGCYIENAVPSFKSIFIEGNWKRIDNFTENLASQHKIEVLTGQFGHLKLLSSNGTLIDVNLEFDPDVIDYDYEELPSDVTAETEPIQRIARSGTFAF